MKAREIVLACRRLTCSARDLPAFIIIGAQRSGTTSLYNYLTEHPCIKPAWKKEVHFFDNNFHKGISWYKAHFPHRIPRQSVRNATTSNSITGEASPYYIFHPHAAKRIRATIPHVKLIILLRNPVDRAYSHHQLELKIGAENLSFEHAIDREEERLYGEVQKIREDQYYYSFNHQHFSYLSRGIYVQQITQWMNTFPKDQILIMKSEDFFSDPGKTIRQVLVFFHLPVWEPSNFRRFQEGQYPEMEITTRRRLANFFELHNERLYECLNRDLSWEK